MIHAYSQNGYNIVLDTASGCVHSVDDVAFDAIKLYGDGQCCDVAALLTEKHPGEISTDEAISLISEIAELERRGKLYSVDNFSVMKSNRNKAPLKALCMNVSHMCNMTCSYCFAGTGEYGGDGELMPLETGKKAIDFLLANSGARKNLDVDFFGGEPLINWGVVKGIVSYARGIEQGKGKKFRFTLTTNALLIDDEVIDFTSREMHNVVLSLDGRPDTNDAKRRLSVGGGSYARVVPNIKRLVEARGGKGYYIRGTYTRDNLDFSNDILHIADLGFRELSMEPAVSKRGDPSGLTMGDFDAISEQYERLAIEILKREKEGRGFTFYHFKIDLKGGPCVHKRIAGCGVGTEYLAVTPSGELYPCHQFVGDSKFLMGDVWRGVVNEGLRDEFDACGIYSRMECKNCWARLYCSGGCTANAYHSTGEIIGVHELGCELFKKRLECAIMMSCARSACDIGDRE